VLRVTNWLPRLGNFDHALLQTSVAMADPLYVRLEGAMSQGGEVGHYGGVEHDAYGAEPGAIQ